MHFPDWKLWNLTYHCNVRSSWHLICFTGPLWGESTHDHGIPLTKGQYFGKCFHVMTSSCYKEFLSYRRSHQCRRLCPTAQLGGHIWQCGGARAVQLAAGWARLFHSHHRCDQGWPLAAERITGPEVAGGDAAARDGRCRATDRGQQMTWRPGQAGVFVRSSAVAARAVSLGEWCGHTTVFKARCSSAISGWPGEAISFHKPGGQTAAAWRHDVSAQSRQQWSVAAGRGWGHLWGRDGTCHSSYRPLQRLLSALNSVHCRSSLGLPSWWPYLSQVTATHLKIGYP